MSDAIITSETAAKTYTEEEFNRAVRLATSKVKYKTVVFNSTLSSDMHIALTSEIKSLMSINRDKHDFILSVDADDNKELNIIRVTDEFKNLVRKAIIEIVS